MTKRALHFAEKLADSHIERFGLQKAYGTRDSLVNSYMPLGNAVAVVEKTVKKQADRATLMEKMLERADLTLQREEIALSRVEAIYSSINGANIAVRNINQLISKAPAHGPAFIDD